MTRRGSLVVTLLLVVCAGSNAQEERRLSKPEERAKFHPTKVQAMSAEARAASFAKRLSMEADSPFQGIAWRNLGPEVQGGRILDIRAPKNFPDRLLVTYATGGLWQTEDDGASWKSLFDDHSAFGIGATAVSADGNTIWLGTGEANSQRTSYSGTGVFKSTDAGKTWRNVGLPESRHIGRVAIDPRDENTVYVAAIGHLYSQNPERGVYRTKDGGKTWKHVLRADEFTGAIDLIVNPRNPQVLLAVMWDRDRRAWNFRESGSGSALYRSENGGDTWAKVTTVPSGDAAGRIGIAQSPKNPNRVYAYVDNQADDDDWLSDDERLGAGKISARRFTLLNEEMFVAADKKVLETFWGLNAPEDQKLDDVRQKVKDKKLSMKDVRAIIEKRRPNLFDPGIVQAELFVSDDGGRSFRPAPIGRLGNLGGYYWGTLSISPHDENVLFLHGVPLLRTTDGGKSWASVAKDAHVDHHAVWVDTRNPKKVWIGNDGGLYLSMDGGDSVRHVNNVPVAQATTLAVDNKSPYNIYIGLQDNGTLKGPSTYEPGKSDITAWKTIFGGDGSHISVDPRGNGDIVYVAYQFGEHFGTNQKTGEQWRTRAEPAKGEPAARYNWISPLIISPHAPDIVYLGAQRVYRSFDQGRKWTPISPDLTKNRPNGDVPHSTVKDLSESPFRFGLIYAGCDDGNLKMTPDGGFQWIDISTPEKDKWVSRVVASKHDIATVYVSQSGYREDDFRALLWKSTDYGKTWSSIVGNLPDETINVVREDPKNKQVLYVGTDMGVFITLDVGKNWEALPNGMPNLPVHDLAIQEREMDLVAATHARGVYVVSLKTILSITPEIRAKDLTVFEVPAMTRGERWGFESIPLATREAPKPPTVSVRFFTRSPGKASIRLLDKDGKVVKTETIDALKGFNEKAISLRLDERMPLDRDKVRGRAVKSLEDALADPYADQRPAFVAAGEYKIEVTVNGATATQPFKLNP